MDGSAYLRACVLFLTLCVTSAVSLRSATQEYPDIVSTFFESSRIFQNAPQEGITVLSNTEFDATLLNGESDDYVSTFVFMPPVGATPDQYEMAFICNSQTVVTPGSCSISNAEAQIVNSDATAYNTTVTCSFAQFPGTVSCELTATPITTLRSVRGSSARTNVSLASREDKILRQTSLPSYSSSLILFNVYGIVFYLPDSSGKISSEATIVSGNLNSYELATYDRTDQGIREVHIAGSVPGLGSFSGVTAMEYFREASVTTEIEDYILWYDSTNCQLTDASLSNSGILLPERNNCAIGIASTGETSSPKMGFHLRTYKSGKYILNMAWNSFGSRQEAYEQRITFHIIEPAPPVIVSVEREQLYKSVPCQPQGLRLVAYNVRLSDKRSVIVTTSDNSTVVWSEKTSSYESSTDQSILYFESAGGLGTEVPFTLIAQFARDKRNGIVLDSSFDTTLSFSSPPALTGMSPRISSVDGADLIVLTGSFDGFATDGLVYVGGYTVYPDDSDSIIFDSESKAKISFLTPKLSDLGQSFSYEVSVGVCAERSSSLTLSYVVSPTLTITATDSSIDETGSFIVPRDGSASFLAEVSGNNDGVQYAWKVSTSSGDVVSTGDATTNSQLFVLAAAILSSPTEVYTVTCEATNSLALTDTSSISAKLSEAGAIYLAVNVYDIENLSRSVDTVTLVQSSVQYITDSESVQSLTASDVILEWNYLGQRFKVENISANGDITGPTQFGLEFNIARKDLIVGEQVLELVAYLADNPDVRGSDNITVRVKESALQPDINGGVNGTLVLEGDELFLDGGRSSDPDVLVSEGDKTANLEYEWFSCQKSLSISFSTREDCVDIFPDDTSSSGITISAASLSDARLDTSTSRSTFLLFGLRVKKGTRSAETYSWFELRTVSERQAIPEITSLKVVDMKGVPLEEVSTFSDIIIQPQSIETTVQWAFEMSLISQRFLFTKNGVLKSGAGFVTETKPSRDLLGFSAGSLEPSTEYKVRVIASSPDSSLETRYEVSFRTADAPTLKCIAPEVTSGTVSDTRFVISAQLSFETQSVEYCFQLVSSPTAKYTVGKGCSPLPFAEFSFPMAGTFAIECTAKTVTGAVIERVSPPAEIVLSTPPPDPLNSIFDTLSDRLAFLSAEVDDCEALRDHSCIETLIATAPSFMEQVSNLTEGNTSEAAEVLIDNSREYVARLSLLSEALAEKTVYRPNQIEDSVDQALQMSRVSGEFVNSDETLFAFMTPAENAVNSTQTNSSQPVIGNEIVDKVSGLANLTLSTALNIAQEGSSRSRLRQNADGIRLSFAAMLNTATGLIGKIRAQQETCGYSGSESTLFPASLEGRGRPTSTDGAVIPPLDVRVQVSCSKSQLSTGLQGTKVGLDICDSALSDTEIRRVVVILVGIPYSAIDATGIDTRIKSYVYENALLVTQGLDLPGLPQQCLQVIMKREESTIGTGDFDQLVGGLLTNMPTSTSDCAVDQCFLFEETGDVTFGEKEVVIQTNREGLFTAGNYTIRAVAPPSFISLEGVGVNAGGQTARAIGAGIAFIVGAALATWISVSNFCVASAPESAGGQGQTGPVDKMWEYCERDLFGRESHLKDRSQQSVSEAQLIVPAGAKPPGA